MNYSLHLTFPEEVTAVYNYTISKLNSCNLLFHLLSMRIKTKGALSAQTRRVWYRWKAEKVTLHRFIAWGLKAFIGTFISVSFFLISWVFIPIFKCLWWWDTNMWKHRTLAGFKHLEQVWNCTYRHTWRQVIWSEAFTHKHCAQLSHTHTHTHTNTFVLAALCGWHTQFVSRDLYRPENIKTERKLASAAAAVEYSHTHTHTQSQCCV